MSAISSAKKITEKTDMLSKSVKVEAEKFVSDKLDLKKIVLPAPKKKVEFDAGKWQKIMLNIFGNKWSHAIEGIEGSGDNDDKTGKKKAVIADIKTFEHAKKFLAAVVNELEAAPAQNLTEKTIGYYTFAGRTQQEYTSTVGKASATAITEVNSAIEKVRRQAEWMIECLEKPGVCDEGSVISDIGRKQPYMLLDYTLKDNKMTYIHFLSVIEPIVNEINTLEAALEADKKAMLAKCGNDDNKKKIVEKFFKITADESKDVLNKDKATFGDIADTGFTGIGPKLREIKEAIKALNTKAITEGVKIADVDNALKSFGFSTEYMKAAIYSAESFMKCAGGPTGFTPSANGSALADLLTEGATKGVAEKVKEFVDNCSTPFDKGLPTKISEFTGHLLGAGGPAPGPSGNGGPDPVPNGDVNAQIAALQNKINTLTASIGSIANQITALQNQGVSGQISEQQMGEIKGEMAQMQAYLKNTDENTVKVGNHVIEVDKKIDGVQKQIGKLLEEGLPEKDDEEDEKKDKKKDPFDDLLKQLSEDDKDEKKEKKAEASEDNGMQQLMMMMMMMMNGQGNKSMNNMLPMMMMMMNDGKSM